MKTLLTILFSVCATVLIHGQAYVDLVSVHHIQQIKRADGLLPQDSPYTESTFDLTLPIVVSDRIALLTGVIAERTYVRDVRELFPTIYGISLKVGANIKHSDRWSGTYVALPKLSGTMENVDRSLFQIGGIILAKYRVHSTFNLRFGVYANREFFGPFVVPLIGLYYQEGRFEMKGVLPINAEVNFALAPKKVHVGARFDGINRSYDLGNATSTYAEKANNEICIFGQYAFSNVLCRLMIGQSVGRKLSSFDRGDKVSLALPLYKFDNQRQLRNQVQPNGVFAKISLIYRLPTS